MVFTISCSGEDGKNGKAGDSCTISDNGDGTYEVSCGNVPQGQLGGGNGTKGNQGKQGDKGATGAGCWLGPQVDGAYQILCGQTQESSEVVGNIGSCIVKRLSAWETNIVCGSNTVGVCVYSSDKSVKTFDVSKEYCTETGEVAELKEEEIFFECPGNKDKYDSRKQYCAYASEEDFLSLKMSILPLCGRPAEGGNTAKPNNATTVSSPDFKVTLVEYEEFPNEYCRYYGPSASNAEVAEPELCGSASVKLNENGWKREYCGYASATANIKTVLSGACKVRACDLGVESGDCATGEAYPSITKLYKGPNEQGYDRGYCAYTKAGELFYSEQICGTTSANKPNQEKGKAYKGEYCGYENSKNLTKKVQTGACDYQVASNGNEDSLTVTPIGPNSFKYGYGYCQANRQGVTIYVDGDEVNNSKDLRYNLQNNARDINYKYGWYGANIQDLFCDPAKDSSNSSVAEYSRAASTRLNEGKWNKQYCGNKLTEKEVIERENGTTFIPARYSSNPCDEDRGSSANIEKGFGGLASDSGYWDNVVSYTLVGPDSKYKGYGYCAGDKFGGPTGLGGTYYTDYWCTTKLNTTDPTKNTKVAVNKDSFKNEYCGFSNSTAPTGLNARSLISKTGCDLLEDFEYDADDAYSTYTSGQELKRIPVGPLFGQRHSDAYSGTSKARYCRPTTASGIGTYEPINGSLVYTYLTASTGEDETCQTGANTKVFINQGEWKGEYCGFASNTAPYKSVLKASDAWGGKACGLLAPKLASAGNPETEALTAGSAYNSTYTKFSSYCAGTLGGSEVVLAGTGTGYKLVVAKPEVISAYAIASTSNVNGFSQGICGVIVASNGVLGGSIVASSPVSTAASDALYLNLGSWKGEYCFRTKDNDGEFTNNGVAKAVCKGNTRPNPKAAATDATNIRCLTKVSPDWANNGGFKGNPVVVCQPPQLLDLYATHPVCVASAYDCTSSAGANGFCDAD